MLRFIFAIAIVLLCSASLKAQDFTIDDVKRVSPLAFLLECPPSNQSGRCERTFNQAVDRQSCRNQMLALNMVPDEQRLPAKRGKVWRCYSADR